MPVHPCIVGAQPQLMLRTAAAQANGSPEDAYDALKAANDLRAQDEHQALVNVAAAAGTTAAASEPLPAAAAAAITVAATTAVAAAAVAAAAERRGERGDVQKRRFGSPVGPKIKN